MVLHTKSWVQNRKTFLFLNGKNLPKNLKVRSDREIQNSTVHFYSKRVVVLSIIKPLFSVAVLHTLLSFVYVHNKTPSRRIIDGKKEKMVTSRWAFSIAETCFQLLFLCCCCCFHFSLHMYLPTSFVLISGSSGKW